MMKCKATLLFTLFASIAFGQNVSFNNNEFELKNVTGSVVRLNGEKVFKIERDLKALPFDVKNLVSTVDEPTYAKLKGVEFENGIIEVKVLSRVQKNTPFEASQGFIGIAFRVDKNDTAYESIYLRPKVGRSESQVARNHTVQYYSYPDYKFDRLRKESNGRYETYADIGLDEWIALRFEVKGSEVKLYINGQKHPSFIVSEMKGRTKSGSIALWVDIGTEGYFKNLKVYKKIQSDK